MVNVLRGDLLATTVNTQLLKSRVEPSPSLCCFIRLALNRINTRLQAFALPRKHRSIPTTKAGGFSVQCLVNAIYKDGSLKLLEDVDLQDGKGKGEDRSS